MITTLYSFKPVVKLCLTCFLVIAAPPVYSQEETVRKPNAQRQQIRDTSQVNLLNDLSTAFLYVQIEKAIQYNKDALTLADKLGYQKGRAEAYHGLAKILLTLRDHRSYLVKDSKSFKVVSVKTYLDYALAAFEKLNSKQNQAATLTSLTTFYLQEGQAKEALKVLSQSERIFRKSHDVSGRGRVAYQLGDIYYLLRDYPTALKYYLQARKLQSSTGDSLALAATLLRIGDLSMITDVRHTALDSYIEAIKFAPLNKYPGIYAEVAVQISKPLVRTERYDEALAYLKYGLIAHEDYFGSNQSSWRYQKEIELTQQYGELYKDQRKFTQSLAYFEKALRIIEDKKPYQASELFINRIGKSSVTYLDMSMNLLTGEAYIQYQISQVYFLRGNYTKSVTYAKKSLQLAQNENLIPIIRDAHLALSRLYDVLGQYRKAYTHQLRYIVAKEQLENTDRDVKVAALKISLNYNNQESQLTSLWQLNQAKESELEQQKQRNYALLGALILFILLVVVLVRNNRRNRRTSRLLAEQSRLLEAQRIRELEQTFEQKQAQSEMAGLRAQMNPHFIFNCLNSIQFFTAQHDADKAAEYLTKFSRLIRLVLENSKSEKVSLANELETLRLYIDMEAMRFPQKIHYQVHVSDSIDTDSIQIPPLLLQPFVENAIWHGLMHKDEGGTVRLRIELPDEQLLHVEITDDGVGRAKAAEYKSKSTTKHKSFGVKITAERIALINQLFNTQTQVLIQDLVDEQGRASGTAVSIVIPV